MIKSIISILLALITAFCSLPFSQINLIDSDKVKPDYSYSLGYTNSLGKIISKAIDKSKDVTENELNHIIDVSVDERKAKIDYVSDIDGKAIINIIDETTNEVVNYAVCEISSDKNNTVTTFENDNVPDNYIIEASLVDDDYNPVSNQYKTVENTQWYEDFSELKVSDFSSDLVVNLDETQNSNFMVFFDSVKFADNVSNNDLVYSNDDEGIYTFSNTNKDIDELKEGDIWCYNKDNPEDMIIGKVDSVEKTSSNTTVKIQESKIDETFQIVKIEYSEDECQLENSEDINQESESKINTASLIDKDFTTSISFKMQKGNLSGSVKLSAGFTIKVDWNAWNQYFSTTLKLKPKFEVSLSVKSKYEPAPFRLGGFVIPTPIVGLTVNVDVNLKFEASCSLSLGFSVSRTIGFSWSTTSGATNLSTNPTTTLELKFEGKIKFGLEFVPTVCVAGVAKTGFKGFAGVELSGNAKYSISNNKRHDCSLCVEGTLYGVCSLEFTIKVDLFVWSKEWKHKISGEYKVEICKCHYSFTYNEFGFGPCDHYSYLTNVKVVDVNGKPILNAKVDGTSVGSNGIAQKWYSDGQHYLMIRANGYVSKKLSIGVSDPKTYTVKLNKGSSADVEEEVDSSYYSYKKKVYSYSGYGFSGGYVLPPLTFTEPLTGTILSTSLAGQRRSDTAWVQRELKKLGYYSFEPDGYYGYSTAEAVRKFQADYDLPITGQVNRNVVEIIKKPIKKVSAPVLKLTSSANIPNGGIASVSWDAVSGANEYNIYVYNANGEMVANAIGTKATNAAFVLFEKGTYTIKAESKNDRFTSEMSTLGTVITVTAPLVVTFEDLDGNVLCRQYVSFGAAATAPAAPEKEGYTFCKWDTDFSKVTEDGLIVKPIFNKNQYTVKFLNTDGKEIITENNRYYYGDSAIAPSEEAILVPTGYKFIGWDKDFSNIYEDITVSPVIVWENDDIPIQIDSCSATKDEGFGYTVNVTLRNFEKQRTNGRVVVALKNADEKFVTMTESSAFTLKKSDAMNNVISTETMEIFVPCNIDVAYADVYVVDNYDDLIPISDTCRINLSNDSQVISDALTNVCSGTVDSSLAGKRAIIFVYKIGDAADFTNEFIGQTVIDDNGNYSFNYKLREEPSIETGDYYVVLGIEGAEKAIFLNKIIAPKPVYTVTFKDFDGSVIKTEQVQQGEHAELPERNPERPGYNFAGWDYTNSSIYEDLTITALYTHKVYTVVFIDWTNKRFDAQTYYYGEPLRTPDLSTLDDYDAIGWEGAVEGMTVTENMVITAKYEKKMFTVNFYDNNGNIINSQNIEYGEAAIAPEINGAEYNFYGWNNEAYNCVTCSMDIYPCFSYVEDSKIPESNVESGVYSNNVTVTLSCDEEADIYYSVNGSEFVLYSSPFIVDESAVVEYYSSTFGKNTSDTATNYYAINKTGEEDEWKIPVTVYCDGNIIGVYLVEYGSKISENELYSGKYGYDFIGFGLDENLDDTVQDNYTFIAPVNLYVKNEARKYTVTFKDNNGNIISVQEVTYMDAAIEPEVIVEQPDLIFIGWDSDDFLCVTKDIEVHVVTVNINDYFAINLNRDSYTMMEGYTYYLIATINGNTDAELFWESSDESIATVDENGIVSALSDGVVVITVSLLGTDVSETCFINVIKNSEMSLTLKDDSKYVDYEGYICGISPSDNSVLTIKSQLVAESNVRFFNGDDELNDNDIVLTGTMIKMYDSCDNEIDSSVIVVIGDVDGDGDANLQDASHISKYIINKESLDEISLLAADVNGDGFVNNKDASMIMRYQVNKENI